MLLCRIDFIGGRSKTGRAVSGLLQGTRQEMVWAWTAPSWWGQQRWKVLEGFEMHSGGRNMLMIWVW